MCCAVSGLRPKAGHSTCPDFGSEHLLQLITSSIKCPQSPPHSSEAKSQGQRHSHSNCNQYFYNNFVTVTLLDLLLSLALLSFLIRFSSLSHLFPCYWSEQISILSINVSLMNPQIPNGFSNTQTSSTTEKQQQNCEPSQFFYTKMKCIFLTFTTFRHFLESTISLVYSWEVHNRLMTNWFLLLKVWQVTSHWASV